MKRRPGESDAFSLDSLLDTLTCVVGVLIIVMAITQLVVLKTARAVSLVPRTQAEVDLKQSEIDDVRTALEELQSRWGTLRVDFPSNRAAAEDANRQLDNLRSGLPDAAQVASRLDAATAGREEAEAALALLESHIAALNDENSRLQAQLDTAAQPTEIQLPERRQVAVSLDAVQFIVKGGRVYRYDTDALAQAFSRAVADVSETFTTSMSSSARIARVINYFNANDVGDESIRLSIRRVMNNGQLYGLAIVSDPRETGAGEAIDEIGGASSGFSAMIRGIDPLSQYVRFSVYADSFATYLEARAVSERLHAAGDSGRTTLAASWLAYAMDEQIEDFWDVFGNRGNTSGQTGNTNTWIEF